MLAFSVAQEAHKVSVTPLTFREAVYRTSPSVANDSVIREAVALIIQREFPNRIVPNTGDTYEED